MPAPRFAGLKRFLKGIGRDAASPTLAANNVHDLTGKGRELLLAERHPHDPIAELFDGNFIRSNKASSPSNTPTLILPENQSLDASTNALLNWIAENPKKAAAIGAGGAAAGTVLSPEEAEAGWLTKKQIQDALRLAANQSKLTAHDLAPILDYKSGSLAAAQQNRIKDIEVLSEILNESRGSLSGLPKNKILQKLYDEYPTLQAALSKDRFFINPRGRASITKLASDPGEGTLGKMYYNEGNPLLYIKNTKNPEILRGVLHHELEHVDDLIHSPTFRGTELSRSVKSSDESRINADLWSDYLLKNPDLRDALKLDASYTTGTRSANAALQKYLIDLLNKDRLFSSITSPAYSREVLDLGHMYKQPHSFEIKEISKLVNSSNDAKKIAAIAAVPTTALAASTMSPEAEASTDPDLMRQVDPPPPNYDKWGILPEGQEPRNLAQDATNTLGKWGAEKVGQGVEAVGKGLDTVDKYTGRPVRAAAVSAMRGNNPITAARDSIAHDIDTTGEEVAHEFLKNSEKAGITLRAPEQEEYSAELPLGLLMSAGLDLTNLTGIGAARQGSKSFEKAYKALKDPGAIEEAAKVTEKSLPALLDMIQQVQKPSDLVAPRIEPSFNKLRGVIK